MVGDDPRMDMAAKEAGIATWLAVGADGRAPREAPLADHRGTLGQLAAWLRGPDRTRRYFSSHFPSRRISLLFPPGSSAVSEALKTT